MTSNLAGSPQDKLALDKQALDELSIDTLRLLAVDTEGQVRPSGRATGLFADRLPVVSQADEAQSGAREVG